MKKNLIFVSLDTVRADVAYSGKFKAIENLRSEGVTFLNTISSSPLTPVSHATVFTGLQPFNHGVRHLFKEKISENAPTLAEILKSEGYKTGAVVSCPGMNKWYGFSRGFDHYDDEIPLLADGSDPLQTVDVKKRGTALKRAEVVAERAIKWVSENKDVDPFFLFIHFFDAHWPYEAPQKFGGDNMYEEEVAYSDHYLGKFLTTMEEMNVLENTTIVCFSDHGEDLDGLYPNDKGGEKLGHPEELGHGCLLYDQTQKVILIIKDKTLPNNCDIPDQVRLVDVMPTTLKLLGIQKNISFDGVSLLPILSGEKLNLPAYSETYYPEEQTVATGGKFAEACNKKSIRIKNSEKIITHLNSDYIEIYDLKQDPNEIKNLLKNYE
ncbi:MAG: sulfatase-like hydrolase/transferase [Candidatus Magasanikbacteria bacterium]|uniref:Sulfatase n=1 Tax=Candidatus Magasanikbacteria bacterium CG10_big_fil_rev_8_21_14_0_10_40_10 TaxID=1974648 RepID=A0A2M6W3A4_9BACT|nr:sulfatase-like hydrolase/transferase [Candidatus Magasanikbacteria bacterium]PIT87200.1 MAG: sulfatase [Candidatus Magasanikbacteria bacterium CG10_big_fil_rev_8_21_14_0_10_40_10]